MELVEVPRKGERCGQKKFRSQSSAKMGEMEKQRWEGSERRREEEERAEEIQGEKTEDECTPLWREAPFQVRVCKAHQSGTTFGS